MPRESKANELTLFRIYEAPVKIVWEAWTDPKQAAKWWGPRGFTLTSHSKELKPGGIWHYTMHGPDGTDYPNKTLYLEVEKYKRLVYDHGGNDEQAPLFRVTVLFEEVGGKTHMEMTTAWPSPEEASRMKKFIKDVGGNSTWDRLAEYLEKTDSENEVFVINRSFDTSVDTLFEMWTNPKHVSQWLNPSDKKLEYIDREIAEGKSTFYKMSLGNGQNMYGKTSYLKIEKPHYLEYIQMFCNEAGDLSSHPMIPHWPKKMLTKVKFSEEGINQARATLTWSVEGDYTKEELQTFINMKSGMSQGWTRSFDNLEDYLL